MKIKIKKIDFKSISNHQWVSVAACLALTFSYGALLLMIGYTNNGLQQITGINGNATIALAIPQSIALICGTVMMKKLLKYFNMRLILGFGYGLAIIALVLLSQLDRMTGTNTYAGYSIANNQTKALVTYIILNFSFGLGISLTSPLVNTYLGQIFNHKPKTRTKIISFSNGIYGIGAGIIPLAFAAVIYNKQHNAQMLFNSVRLFYYIAIVLAALGFIVTFLIAYKCKERSLRLDSQEEEAQKTQEEKSKKEMDRAFNKTLISIIFATIAIFTLYEIIETTFTYSFTHFFNQNSKANKITIIQAFGLFVCVQGLHRCFSGFFINPYMKNRNYVIVSVLFLISAFIIILSNSSKNAIALSYLVAVFVGLGLGNLWPVFFDYTTSLDKQKTPLISYWANSTSMVIVSLTQIMLWGIYTSETNRTGQIIVSAIGIGFVLGLVGVIVAMSIYGKKQGLTKHSFDEKKLGLLHQIKTVVKKRKSN